MGALKTGKFVVTTSLLIPGYQPRYCQGTLGRVKRLQVTVSKAKVAPKVDHVKPDLVKETIQKAQELLLSKGDDVDGIEIGDLDALPAPDDGSDDEHDDDADQQLITEEDKKKSVELKNMEAAICKIAVEAKQTNDVHPSPLCGLACTLRRLLLCVYLRPWLCPAPR